LKGESPGCSPSIIKIRELMLLLEKSNVASVMSENLALLKAIDHQMMDAFQKSSQYDEQQFHAVPDNAGWSLQQVLFHLWNVTDLAIEVMEKQRSKAGNRDNIGIGGRFRSALIKAVLWLPFKFKAPKNVSHVPNDLSFDELKERWDNTVTRAHELIDAFPAHLEDKPIFKHPAAGWFSLNQTMEFIADHNEHHQRQLDALYSWLDQ
jgi:hypothetical protein